jgi:hypothetical protein
VAILVENFGVDCLLFYGAKLTGENIVDVGVSSPATAPENLLMAQ